MSAGAEGPAATASVGRVHNDNDSRRSIARNALAGYGVLAVSLLTGFISTPLVLRALGTPAYGAYALVGGLVAYLAIADAGVGTTTSNRVARFAARGDRDALRSLLGTSFWIFCAAGAAGLVVAVVLALQLAQLFTVPASLLGPAQLALVLLALGQGLGVPLSLNSLVLIGVGRLDVTAVRTMLFSTLSSIAQVVVAKAGGGVAGVAGVSSGFGLLGALYLWRQVRRRYPDVRISPSAGSVAEGKDLVRTGSRNLVISVAGMLAFTSDLTIIGALEPLAAVAAYALASKLVSYVRLLSSRLTDVLMPVYAHGDSLGLDERQRSVFAAGTTLSLGLAIPMTLCCVAFGNDLLATWLGHVPAGTASVLTVLALASLAQLPGHNCFVLLTALERTHVLLRLSVVSSLVNVALSVALTIRLGIVGPALGSLVVTVVADLVILPAMVSRAMGWGYAGLVKQALGPVLLPSVAGGVVAATLAPLDSSPSAALLKSLAVALVFGAVLARTALSPVQRAGARWALRSVRSRRT